jgi:hypothetical protein
MLRASYSVDRATSDPILGKMVFIVDNDVGMSITNDAEAVVEDVLRQYPDHRIIYRDTMGQWDELVHWNGKFSVFKPYRS